MTSALEDSSSGMQVCAPDSSVCQRWEGHTDVQVWGWSGRQDQAAPRWSGRARGQVGCRAQAWGGVQEHSKTATPPRALQGAEWLPRDPGAQTGRLPAGLFSSGILEPTTQRRDTHEKSWLQPGRGGPEITKPSAADGVWTAGP